MANFVRDTSKEVLLPGTVNVSGVAFGDSTLFISRSSLTDNIYRYKGDTYIGDTITWSNLQTISRQTGSSNSNPDIGRIAFVGNSALYVFESRYKYLLYINTTNNTGTTSKHLNLPSNFAIESITKSGDSIPWVFTNRAIKRLSGSTWVDKISQTTLTTDLGDSAPNIYGMTIGDTSTDLFLVTNKHIHYYKNDVYQSKFDLPYTASVAGAAWGNGGIYIASNAVSGQSRRLLFFDFIAPSNTTFTRIPDRTLSSSLNDDGLTYGDSILFQSTSVTGLGERISFRYMPRGSRTLPFIDETALINASNAANVKFNKGDTNTFFLSSDAKQIAYIGDSTLVVVFRAGNSRRGLIGNYLLYFNIATGNGITALHRQLPSSFALTDMTDSGDSWPWITNGSSVQRYNHSTNAWVDKISQTTLNTNLGDSSTRINGLTRNGDSLYLVTPKALHRFVRDSYIESFDLPVSDWPYRQAAWDPRFNNGDGGVYILRHNVVDFFGKNILIRNISFDFTTGIVVYRFVSPVSVLPTDWTIRTGEIDFEFDAIAETPVLSFTKVNRGPPSSLDGVGLAFGDSTFFLIPNARNEIRKFKGDTYLSPITLTQLNALRTTIPASERTQPFMVDTIAYMGDSTLSIFDASSNRIYFLDTNTHIGDTSKIVRGPTLASGFDILDMTRGGDSTPWLLTQEGTNYNIYEYEVGDSTTTETRPTGPPVTTTQYRTTGDTEIAQVAPGRRDNVDTRTRFAPTSFNRSGINAFSTYTDNQLFTFFRNRTSVGFFRESRTRYRTGTWESTREAALTAGRFTEVVTSANVSINTLSRTLPAATTPTQLSDFTDNRGRILQGYLIRIVQNRISSSGINWSVFWVPTPLLQKYNPKVETRQQTVQGDTTVTIPVKTTTWSIKVGDSALSILGTGAENTPKAISKGTSLIDIYVTSNSAINYFANDNRIGNFPLEAGDSGRTWATAWNSATSDLYVLKNNIKTYNRVTSRVALRIETGDVDFAFQEPRQEAIIFRTVWERGDTTNDIDLISYGNIAGLTHDGTKLYIGDRTNSLILTANPTTKAIGAFVDFGDPIPGGPEYPGVDALTYGDSKIWVGDASNKKLYSYDLDGRNPTITDIPETVTPVGLAHNGDTDTLPYILDSASKSVLSYKERKNIIEPVYGDSYVNFVFYEPVERQTPITRYRITGDTEITSTYTSIGVNNRRGTATRYYTGDTDYATLEEAIEAAKYDYSYTQTTETRGGRQRYRGDTTVCVPKPKRTEYRVIGEIDRGRRAVSVTCADVVRGQTYFQKTYQRYRNTGWFSSRNDAIRASLYTGTQRFNPDSTGFGAYINGRLVAQNASCNTGLFHSRIAHRSYYVHINPPRGTTTIPHRLPRVITRQTGGGDSCTTIQVDKYRDTTSTVKKIRHWEPVWEPVGDTLVENVQQKITRRIDVRPLISPGDSSTTITGWGEQVNAEALRTLSPGFIPSGISFGPSKNLFVLDSNEDKAWFISNGEERFPDTDDQDLITSVMREPNPNIVPEAIAWDRTIKSDRSSGFYVSDTQAKKLWWYQYTPVLEMRFRTGPLHYNFFAKIADLEWNTGEPTISWDVVREIYVNMEFRTGNPEFDFVAFGDTNPLGWEIETGEPTVSLSGFAAPTINFPISFTTGDPSINFNLTPEQRIILTISTGEPEIRFEGSREIYPTWNITTGNPTIGFDLDAIESIPIEFTTGDPAINWDVELRETINVPMEFRTGNVEFEFDAFRAPVINPQLEISTGDPEVEFDVRSIITYPAYIEFTINTAPSSPLVEFQLQTETTIVPNLLEAETDSIDIMSDIPSIDGPQLKKYTTKAYAHYELTTARSLTPRARRGDTFSDIRYPFPHVTREPTPIDQSTPQLTVPMPTIRHQNRQVILHWSEQQGLLPTRSQLQVSENENGPWFAPDLTDNNEFRTGDSGGFATTEGFEEVIPNIPLKGTADIPEPRTLCYRVRRIDNDGDVSEWSPPVAVTLNPLQTQEYGSQSITSSKFVQHLFGSQGVGDRLTYWSMDDTAGDEGRTPTELRFLQDTSETGNPYPLKVSGRQIRGVTGIVSRAIYLDGWNNYSYATSGRIGTVGDSWNEMSMMAFVKLETFQPQTEIGLLAYYLNDNNYININYVKNTRILRVRVGDSWIVNSQPLTLLDNSWRQIGFNYNAVTKNLQLWLDGALLHERTIGDTQNYIAQGGYIGVGGLVYLNSIGEPFLSNKIRGAIDEVRTWKRVLSADEFRFFRNFPKGAGNSQFITPDRILEGSISADKLAANAIDVLFANIHGRALFGTPVDVENTAQGFRTHIDSDEIRIQRIKDSQWVDHGRIWQTQEGAYAIFNGDLSETDFFGDTTQFLANVAIEPNRIVVTRGTGRAVQTPRKISMQQLVGDTWVERARFTRNHLAFYDTSGNELTTIGQNFNVGDSLGFDGGYVITKKPNQNVLDFSGSINAISIPQSTLSGTINQDDFYFIIDPLIETSAKVSGYGYLKENSGGNTPFKGPIHAISKTGTNLSIQGFNVDTNESQTLTVGSTITAKLFDSYSLAV